MCWCGWDICECAYVRQTDQCYGQVCSNHIKNHHQVSGPLYHMPTCKRYFSVQPHILAISASHLSITVDVLAWQLKEGPNVDP